MINLCCEPLVKTIVSGMNRANTPSREVHIEACRLALITRWAGEHHKYFWKLGIDKVLLNLVLENFHQHPIQHLLSVEKQISQAREALNANFLPMLRLYVWDILGWLSIHCEEDFKNDEHGNELYLDLLIICAWYLFLL